MSPALFPNRCLRPAFTQALAGQLSAGVSLMLTSPHGQGRRRTLRDLRSLLPSSLRVLQANLRDCPEDFEKLLETLAEQAGVTGVKSIDELLDQLSQPSLIILHNFDELQPGKASGYDEYFFSSLNGMANHEGVSLLCVCECERHELPLAIVPCPLPPLTQKEITAELCLRGVDDAATLAGSIAADAAPYSAIEAIAQEGNA